MIGKKILTGRKLLELSQEEFANSIGISTTELIAIEDEQKVPSKEILKKIAGKWEMPNIEIAELSDIVEHILTNTNKIRDNLKENKKAKSPIDPKHPLVKIRTNIPGKIERGKNTIQTCGLQDIIIVKDKSYSNIDILYNGNTNIPEGMIVLSKRTVDIYSFANLLKRMEKPLCEWSLEEMSDTIQTYPELTFMLAVENPNLKKVISKFQAEKMLEFYMMGMSIEEKAVFRNALEAESSTRPS